MSLPLCLVLSQVSPLTQAASLPEAVLHTGGQRGHVSEAEVDPLTGERMDAVGGVTDEDSAGPDVPMGVTKTQGKGCTIVNT